MLISALVGIDSRTTMDMDATIKGYALGKIEVQKFIEDVISITLEDGIIFSLNEISEIREESDYPGFRVTLTTTFDRTKQVLKIDITTGDYVTPKEITYNYKLMFENRFISILAYNVETVLAEKFETLISRSVLNTRMRDYYDLYILTSTQEYDAEVFKQALEKTAEKRGTIVQIKNQEYILDKIYKSPEITNLWKRYQQNYSYAENISLQMVFSAISRLSGKV